MSAQPFSFPAAENCGGTYFKPVHTVLFYVVCATLCVLTFFFLPFILQQIIGMKGSAPVDLATVYAYNINIDIDILMEVNMPNVNDLLAIAIEETHQLQKGEEFLVRDLFKGYEWNRISRSNQIIVM